MLEVGFIFKGENTQAVLEQVWNTINSEGKEYHSQRGLVKSIKGTALIVTNPLDKSHNYPYWDEKSDNWYQNNFVRKETISPPEIIVPEQDVYTYKYAWRSRYYDGGLGYVKGVIEVLKSLGIGKVHFGSPTEIEDLLKRASTTYHPESLLAVLAWKGVKLINSYLENPDKLEAELASQRVDTLFLVINELKQNISSRRAITPSFIYPYIDQSGAAGGVPVYQNYQIEATFDKAGKPVGLVSYHWHRAMDAMGGTQLDISHDREWGSLASHELGLPLQSMVIYCSDIYYHVLTEGANNHLVEKTNIRNWLFSVTDAYDPRTEDIEKRLASPIYQAKINYTWDKLQESQS